MYFDTSTSPKCLDVKRIISGGQAGADRAALDWAIENGIEHGGWCPQGRRAEDGLIDTHYQLRETPTTKYVQRTEWNVRDADGTVIITVDPRLLGGTKQTLEFARKHKKPLLRLSRTVPLSQNVKALKTFIREHGIQTLNVAGTRTSEEPHIAEFVREVFDKAGE